MYAGNPLRKIDLNKNVCALVVVIVDIINVAVVVRFFGVVSVLLGLLIVRSGKVLATFVPSFGREPGNALHTIDNKHGLRALCHALSATKVVKVVQVNVDTSVRSAFHVSNFLQFYYHDIRRE